MIKLLPVLPESGHEVHCPVRDVLARIGDKWSVLVLLNLSKGTLRFTELKRAIGDVSQRMLAQTLRVLEADGLVDRKVHPSVPPKVEYKLTPLGKSLLRKIDALATWADENHASVRKARKNYVPPETTRAL